MAVAIARSRASKPGLCTRWRIPPVRAEVPEHERADSERYFHCQDGLILNATPYDKAAIHRIKVSRSTIAE